MKYKVGDKVRIKGWEEMVDEFGINANGNIQTRIPYHTRMRKYCGKVMTINGYDCYYRLAEDSGWLWSDDMFEDDFEYKEDVSSNVNHPTHYNDGKIEVIDYIEDKKLGFHLGNAIKYISRAGKKDKAKTKEDIEKAIWYLKRYLEVE